LKEAKEKRKDYTHFRVDKIKSREESNRVGSQVLVVVQSKLKLSQAESRSNKLSPSIKFSQRQAVK